MKLVYALLLVSASAAFQVAPGLQQILNIANRRLDGGSDAAPTGEKAAEGGASTDGDGGGPGGAQGVGSSMNAEWVSTQCTDLKEICALADIDVKHVKVKKFMLSGMDEATGGMGGVVRRLDGTEGEFDFSCETIAQVRYMCNYICGDKCSAEDIKQVSKFSGSDAFTGSDADPISGNDETALDHVCSDNQCLGAIIDGQGWLMDEFWKCPQPAMETMSNLTDGSSKGESPSEQITAQMNGEVGFMCTKNKKNEYCMKNFGEDDSHLTIDLTALTCDTQVMKEAVALGCCHGTMLAFMSGATGDSVPDEAEQIFVEDLTLKLKECGGTIIPCAEGALMDSVTVETTMAVDHTAAELMGNRTLRKEVTKKIYEAIKKSGGNATKSLQESSVMMTSIKDKTATTRGRALGTGAEVGIAATANVNMGGSVEATSKAMSGGVSAATGSTDVTETKTSAKKVESTSTEADEPSFMKYAPDGMSTGAVVGVTVGVLAGIALIVIGAVITHKKKTQTSNDAATTSQSSEITEEKTNKIQL
jgi:hypothetical protein